MRDWSTDADGDGDEVRGGTEQRLLLLHDTDQVGELGAAGGVRHTRRGASAHGAPRTERRQPLLALREVVERPHEKHGVGAAGHVGQ